MEITKKWNMSNKNTFDINCIRQFINSNITTKDLLIIDPFANKNRIANITNDLDSQYDTTYNLDALEFLKSFKDSSVDVILYDPPYSPRQVRYYYICAYV